MRATISRRGFLLAVGAVGLLTLPRRADAHHKPGHRPRPPTTTLPPPSDADTFEDAY